MLYVTFGFTLEVIVYILHVGHYISIINQTLIKLYLQWTFFHFEACFPSPNTGGRTLKKRLNEDLSPLSCQAGVSYHLKHQ